MENTTKIIEHSVKDNETFLKFETTRPIVKNGIKTEVAFVQIFSIKQLEAQLEFLDKCREEVQKKIDSGKAYMEKSGVGEIRNEVDKLVKKEEKKDN